MTISLPAQPMGPVLKRMALGLLLTAGGVLLGWQGIVWKKSPGMSAVITPINLPIDGPLPLDLAESARLNLSSNRLNVTVYALPAKSTAIMQGDVYHRARNPVDFQVSRLGKQVTANLNLQVQSLDRSGVMVSGPEPLQHEARLNLTRIIPLTLSGKTSSGDQQLNLSNLRVRALNARTISGNQLVTLPNKMAGPLSLVSTSGNIVVGASSKTNAETLRVNTVSGTISLNLAGAQFQSLGVGSNSGDVRLMLPKKSQRGTITTASGNVKITVQEGTKGNFDIRTQSGNVTLNIPLKLKLRVRFTNKDTLTWPANLPLTTPPALDVFVDGVSGSFALQDLEGNLLLSPSSPDTQAPIDSSSRTERYSDGSSP